MGPRSYIWSFVDQNLIKWRMTALYLHNSKIKVEWFQWSRGGWPLVPKFTAKAFGFFRAKISSARVPSEGK
jgi:hypothetical protein